MTVLFFCHTIYNIAIETCIINTIRFLMLPVGDILKSIDQSALFSLISILIAMFIPLLVMLWQEIIKQKDLKYNNIDKAIILDEIIKTRKLGFLLLVSCILAMLWNEPYANTAFRFFSAIVIAKCFYTSTTSIIDIYKWIRNDMKEKTDNNISFRYIKRIEFLKQNSDSLEAWKEIISNTSTAEMIKNGLLKEYIDKVGCSKDEDFYFETLPSFIKQIQNDDTCLSPAFQQKIISYTIPTKHKNSDNIRSLRSETVRIICKKFLTENPFSNCLVFHFMFNNKESYDTLLDDASTDISNYFYDISEAYLTGTLKDRKFVQNKITKEHSKNDDFLEGLLENISLNIDHIYRSISTSKKQLFDKDNNQVMLKAVIMAYKNWYFHYIYPYKKHLNVNGQSLRELAHIIQKTAFNMSVFDTWVMDGLIILPQIISISSSISSDKKSLLKTIIDNDYGYLNYYNDNQKSIDELLNILRLLGYKINLTTISSITNLLESYNIDSDYSKDNYYVDKLYVRINLNAIKTYINEINQYLNDVKAS